MEDMSDLLPGVDVPRVVNRAIAEILDSLYIGSIFVEPLHAFCRQEFESFAVTATIR